MSDKFYVGERLVDFRDVKRDKPISKITLLWDEENGFSAGDSTGLELTAECYFATAEIAEKVRAALAGYEYHAFSAVGADIDPAAEPGDGVTACGVYSTLVRYSDDGTGYPDIEAPGEAELEEEFPAEGPLTREIKQKVTLGAAYEGVRITRAKGLEVVKTLADGSERARAQLKSDLLAFYDDAGNPALYFDPEKGRYTFKGDIVVTGGMSGNIPEASLPGWVEDYTSSAQFNTLVSGEWVVAMNLYGSKIFGSEFYGKEFNITLDEELTSGTEGSFNIFAPFGDQTFHFLRIAYSGGDAAPYVNFSSPDDAYCNWYMPNTWFHGNIDFSHASVTGLYLRYA